MKYTVYYFLGFSLFLLLPTITDAQVEKKGFFLGVGLGGYIGKTDLQNHEVGLRSREFIRYGFYDFLQAEAGIGLGTIQGASYKNYFVPIDARIIFNPFDFDQWNPFVYGGAGTAKYSLKYSPNYVNPLSKKSGWIGYLPVGGGVQIRLMEHTLFEVNGGLNYTFSEEFDGYKSADKDAFWGFLCGITVGGEAIDSDLDDDGLTNQEEKELGTDPKIADTDGDGLKDGDEVNVYRTNPLKADTDGDGLNDGEEVNQYKTNPLKADTDDDGLNDGEEVRQYKTDPLKSDTDGDGLKDGEEVHGYKTDPNKADTDGGTVNDGTEIANKTNPLDPSDDVPKKEEIVIEPEKPIVLEGIVFKINSVQILPESERILEKAYNTLEQHPELNVEIHGHTCNIGTHAYNMNLSKKRAESVRNYLVKKGISKSRMKTKGFSFDNPIEPNTTEEGRAKNRRIEFFKPK